MKNEVSLRLLSVPQRAGDEPFVWLLLPKTGNLLPTHVGLEGSAPSTRMMQSLPLFKDTTAPHRFTHLHLTPSKYANTKKPTRLSRPFPRICARAWVHFFLLDGLVAGSYLGVTFFALPHVECFVYTY